MKYDVIIVGAGPGGIFSAYELTTLRPELKVAVVEAGNELKKRRGPIDGDKVKSCIKCKSCAIMSGLAVQAHSPTENIISPTILAALSMST